MQLGQVNELSLSVEFSHERGAVFFLIVGLKTELLFKLLGDRERNSELIICLVQLSTQHGVLVLQSAKRDFEHFLLFLAVHSTFVVKIFILALECILIGKPFHLFSEEVALFVRLNGGLAHFYDSVLQLVQFLLL